ncbi:hypothetical protein GCM10027055_23680 [Janibacter alkaliphilus]|uniref:UDP-N-acetylmuramyl pentapeptide phosphotransferase/UDP-N-acetylglucosamine-1-phosphate transferase n=1 Tax=Janibacter alkaliphilus TaxID=1069963 RepID=A0A852X7D4_9MICO|nr:hypothetical protein [Janibacter alkaliphilus]NYG38327.1 hypothetical protein [Janibacter alkaliphilus]
MAATAPARRMLAAVAAASVTAAATRAATTRLALRSDRAGPGRSASGPGDPFVRRNHAGDPVTLLEGPAWVLGASVGTVTAGGPGRDLLVVLVPGALGLLDDLAGDTTTKGLRGHLGALRRGTVSTGATKVAGLAGVALVVAAREHQAGTGAGALRRGPVASIGVLRDALVVAGSANLVNLFDLRPGRALKVAGALATLALLAPSSSGRAGREVRPAGAGAAAEVALGASLGALPDDLAGRSMLGDSGANPLGALVGLALLRAGGPRARTATAAALVALTLVSERVSFTRVIEQTPWLRRLDEWGRG